MTIGDALWLRLVDLPAAFERRGYAATDRLVLEVRDAFCPWNDGRWEIDATPDVEYGVVVAIMDAARGAGVQKTLMAAPPGAK